MNNNIESNSYIWGSWTNNLYYFSITRKFNEGLYSFITIGNELYFCEYLVGEYRNIYKLSKTLI